MNPSRVSALLTQKGVPHALIGAVALAARGYARSTADIDFLTTDSAVLREEFWNELRSSGAIANVRKGDHDDPLAGVVHIILGDGTDVDVVVGRYRWQRDIVNRAEPVDFQGVTIPIPRTADLVLLKLFAGGHQDVSDIRALLDLPGREALVSDVEEKLEALPDDAQALWRDVRKSL